VEQFAPYVNGVIVASSLKRNGQIEQPIDPVRVSRFVEAWQRAHHKIQELNRANGNCRGSVSEPLPTMVVHGQK
ncbi:MAG: phosphorybosylanthranilate isomerase, partial [Thermosynechococcus sp.]